MPQDYELTLIPGEVPPTPLFPTQEAYEKFREDFMAHVIPIQEKWREAQRNSEGDARHRPLR